MYKSPKGFTLIEVLVALLIFSIVCASTIPAFINHSKFNTNSEIKTISISLAENILNDLRKDDITSLPSSEQITKNYNIKGRNFVATIYFCKTSSYCSTTSRHITVSISYNNEPVYSVETVYTQLK